MARVEGKLEYKYKSTRKEIGEMLKGLAEQFIGEEFIEVPIPVLKEEKIKFKPIEPLTVELELEREGEKTEFKIETKWIEKQQT